MLNYLYVALTRSKNILTILVTKEVEEKYGIKFSKFLEIGIAPKYFLNLINLILKHVIIFEYIF